MAKQLNVDLAIHANTDQAKTSIQELSNLLTKISTTTTPIFNDSEIRKASQAAAELKQHLQAAVDVNTGKLDLSRFSQSLSSAGQDLKYFYTTLNAIGNDGSNAFLKLSSAIASAEAPATRLNGTLASMGTVLKNTIKWQISSSMIHGFIGSIQGAYNYAQKLNESLTNIRIVTQQSSDQMAQFAEQANKAAQSLSTTTTAYTNAALIFYQQGLKGKDVTDRADVAIKLANVTGETASDISNQMTAIWNNFNDGSESLEHYADVITNLGAHTASSSKEISEGLGKFAAVADTVGLSYNYATTALATVVAQTRQSADVVGTAFKTMFSRMEQLKQGGITEDDATTLGKYSQALANVGVNIKDASGQLKDMDQILDETGERWKTLARDEQIALAQTVAGVRQYSQFIALMDNWDTFQLNLEYAENADGALQAQADIFAQSWEGSKKRVQAAAQDIYKSLIDEDFFIKFNDALTGALKGIKSLIDGFGGLEGVISFIGSIFLERFAKEMPTALNNLVSNIKVLSGTAKNEMQGVQSENIAMLETIKNNTSDEALKNQITGIQKLATMNQSLVAAQDQMSKAEQAAYRNKMELVKGTYELIDAMEKEIQKVNESAQAQRSKISSKFTSDLTGNIKDFSNALGKDYSASDLSVRMLDAHAQEDGEIGTLATKIQNAQDALIEFRRNVQELELPPSLSKEIGEVIGKLRTDPTSFTTFKALSGVVNKLVDQFKDLNVQYGKLDKASSLIRSQSTEWKNQAKEIQGNTQATEQMKTKMSAYLSEVQKLAGAHKIDLPTAEIETFSKSLKNMDATQAANSFEALSNTISGAFDDKLKNLAINIDTIGDKLQSMGIDPAPLRELSDSSNDAGQKMAELIFSILNVGNSADELASHVLTLSEALTTLSSGLMQLNMLLNSVTRFTEVFSDKDSTAVQKVGAAIGLLTASVRAFNLLNNKVIPQLTQIPTLIAVSTSKITAADAAIKLNTTEAAINSAVWKTHPLILIITAVIMAVVAAFGIFNAKVKENTEAVQNNATASQELADAKQQEIEANEELIASYETALQTYEETGESKAELINAAYAAAEALKVEDAAVKMLNGDYAGLTKALKTKQAQLIKDNLTNQSKSLTLTAQSLGTKLTGKVNGSGEYTTSFGNGSIGGQWSAGEDEYYAGQLLDSGKYKYLSKSSFGDASATVVDSSNAKEMYAYYQELEQFAEDLRNLDENAASSEIYQGIMAELSAGKEDYEILKTTFENLDNSKLELASLVNEFTSSDQKNIDVTTDEIETITEFNEYRNAVLDEYLKQIGENIEENSDKYKEYAAEVDAYLAQNSDLAEFQLISDGLKNNAEYEEILKWIDTLTDEEKSHLISIGIDEYSTLDELQDAIDNIHDRLEAESFEISITARNGIVDLLEKDILTSKDWDSVVELYQELFDEGTVSKPIEEALRLGKKGLLEYVKEATAGYDATYVESMSDAFGGLEDGIAAAEEKRDEFSKKADDAERDYNAAKAESDKATTDATRAQQSYDNYRAGLGYNTESKNYQYKNQTSSSFFNDLETVAANTSDQELKALIEEYVYAGKQATSPTKYRQEYTDVNGKKIESSDGQYYTNEQYAKILASKLKTKLDPNGQQDLSLLENAIEVDDTRDNPSFGLNYLADYSDKATALFNTLDNTNQLKTVAEETQKTADEKTKITDDKKTTFDSYTEEVADANAIIETNTTELLNNALALNKYKESLAETAKGNGLNIEQWEDYAEVLAEEIKTKNNAIDTELELELASKKLATANLTMNKGLTNLNKNWDTYSKTLKNADASQEEISTTITSLKDDMQDILGIDLSDFTQDWFKNAKNIELFEKAANGSKDAVAELRIEAAKEAIAISLTASDLSKQMLIDDVNDFVTSQEFADLELGATLDDSEFINQLNNMINKSEISVAEAERILQSLGFAPEITYAEVPMSSIQQNETTGTFTYKDPFSGDIITGKSSSLIEGSQEGTLQIPIINGSKTVYSGPPKATVNSNNTNKNGGGGNNSRVSREGQSNTTRYKEINDSLEDLAQTMKKTSREADRLYGTDKINNLKKQNAEIQKQIQLDEKKIKEAKEYLAIDKAALEAEAARQGISFTFDADGDISNYNNTMGDLERQYNAKVDEYNKQFADTMNSEGASNWKEKNLDPLKDKIDALKEVIDQYEETKEIIEDLDDEQQELFNSWQDNNYALIQQELELNEQLRQNEIALVDYYFNKLSDDVYKAAEAMGYLNSKLNTTSAAYGDYVNMQSQLDDAYDAGEISQAAYVEGMQRVYDASLENAAALKDLDEQMKEYYGNTLQMADAEISKYTSRMDNLTEVLDHYTKILELTGQDKNKVQTKKIYQAQADNYKNLYETNYKTWQTYQEKQNKLQTLYDNAKTDVERETYKKALDEQIELTQQAYDQMLTSWEDYVSKLKDILTVTLETLAKEAEDLMTDGIGFDNLTASMDRVSTRQEEYLTNTNKIYETNKMMRKLQQDMDKTDNAVSKQKLKNFQSEIKSLQDKKELSNLELEIAQARYDILIAEMALEEAQNAKSTVRMTRDSEGNYGYVYTANSDAVSDAQQELDDANNRLYNIGYEGGSDYMSKRVQATQDYNNEIARINTEYADNEELRDQLLATAKEEYTNLITSYADLYAIAVGVDANIVQDAWYTAYENTTVYSDTWKTATENHMQLASDAISSTNETIKTFAAESGQSYEDIAEKTKKVTEESNSLAETINEEVIPAMSDELDSVINLTSAYAEQRQGILDKISAYEQLALAAKAAIEAESMAGDGGDDGEGGGKYSDGWNSDSKSGNANKTWWYSEGDDQCYVNGWAQLDDTQGGHWYYFDKDGWMQTSFNGQHIGNYGIDDDTYDAWCDKYGNKMKDATLKQFDTGGYTGEWGDEGKMAILHQKELVLNEDDTANILGVVGLVRDLVKMIDFSANLASMGALSASSGITTNNEELQQTVTITAEFPNAVNHSEIEQAFTNLVNNAAQYANRK